MNEYVKNIDRIEFAVTMACTGKCKHCSEGDHVSCKGHIDADAAVKAVCDLCKIYKIESIMTFGGEPLLYPETVCKIHEAAKKSGIPRRDLITNGFFSKDTKRIDAVVKSLAISGVNTVLLSVDAFHQETIPLEPVKYFAECVKSEGIFVELSPAWLVSKEDHNAYNIKTRQLLKEFESLEIPVGLGNVIFPSGNALKYLAEYFDDNIDFSNPYDDDPYDIKSISFSPNGDVLNGNIYQNEIMDILNEYQPDKIVK